MWVVRFAGGEKYIEGGRRGFSASQPPEALSCVEGG